MASRLIPITVPAPGTRGLNLQDQSGLKGPEWLRRGTNVRIDSSGRLATRSGWVKTHTTALTGTPDVEQVFEFKSSTGVNVVLMCAGNKIYKDSSSPVDITSPTTPTANNWKFQNFNGAVVGYQALHKPIWWDGSAPTFVDLDTLAGSAGTVQSNEVLSAFGRTWVVDPLDNTTLRYSDLLVPEQFTTGSAGFLDLKSVWTKGQDRIIALGAFNNQLVIFGNDTVTVYDGADDVTNLNLAEVIYDIGCVARDSVQYIDDDIVFLSRRGVRSLKRTVVQGQMPQNELTAAVHDDIVQLILAENFSLIRSSFSKNTGEYLISFPSSGQVYNLDIKRYRADNTIRAFKWDSIEPKALYTLETGKVIAGFSGGFTGDLRGYTDNGTSYIADWSTGWSDASAITQSPEGFARLVLLKKIEILMVSTQAVTPAITWAFDQRDTGLQFQSSLADTSSTTEYNSGFEYGTGVEYGGLALSKNFIVNTSGAGRSMAFGVNIKVDGACTSFEYMNVVFKLGKIL